MERRGIIYCRVSSLEQVDGTSLESQERICREYAEREKIEILEVFVDRGESAKTADRPQFLNAIAYAGKHSADYFIVYKLDRFARSQTDHFAVQAQLEKKGTKLRSATEPVDDSPIGKFLIGTLSATAELDNSIRAERSSNGMKARLQQGIWVWPAPIGYERLTKGAVMTPDHNAHFVRLAFSEYAKGSYTYKNLAIFLFEKGLRSEAGKKIELQTIQKMIHNPLYAGIVKKPEWNIEVKGQHEPLITEALFYQCQNTGRKHKGTKKQESNPNFPLRRLVVCDWCKKPLTGSYSTGRHGSRHGYYHHHKQDCPHALSIKKADLEASFVSFLEEINPTFEFANAFKEVCMEIYRDDYKCSKEQNQHIHQQLKTLHEKKQAIFNNFEEGIYSKTDFIERRRTIEKQIHAVQSQLIEISAEFEFESALDHMLSFIASTPKKWKELEKQPDIRLRFQNFIFDDVISYKQNNGFGTAVLSPVYSIYQQYIADESSLVTLRRIELRLPE